MKLIRKLLKMIVAVFLLPFCVGSVMTLWHVVLQTGSAQMIWISTLAGVFCWVLILVFLPEPTKLYVLGHELTHALWSWSMGGKLKEIKVGAEGGHVLITKSNFLTTLAPYFFPFYVLIVIIIFSIGKVFWNWGPYVLVFYFFIGMMYAFHITLTYRILKIEQSDIVKHGYIFSGVIIFIGNMGVLLIGIPLLTAGTSIHTSLNLWLSYSLQIYHSIL